MKLITLGKNYTKKGRVTSPDHRWMTLDTAAVLSFTSGRHLFPPGCTLESPGRLWRLPGTRSQPKRWSSHCSVHPGDSRPENHWSRTITEVHRIKGQQFRVCHFPSSLPFSPSPPLSRDFPKVVAIKWAPSYQVQKKQKMLHPRLRQEYEPNRGYFICHKGKWEMCKTSLKISFDHSISSVYSGFSQTQGSGMLFYLHDAEKEGLESHSGVFPKIKKGRSA